MSANVFWNLPGNGQPLRNQLSVAWQRTTVDVPGINLAHGTNLAWQRRTENCSPCSKINDCGFKWWCHAKFVPAAKFVPGASSIRIHSKPAWQQMIALSVAWQRTIASNDVKGPRTFANLQARSFALVRYLYCAISSLTCFKRSVYLLNLIKQLNTIQI